MYGDAFDEKETGVEVTETMQWGTRESVLAEIRSVLRQTADASRHESTDMIARDVAIEADAWLYEQVQHVEDDLENALQTEILRLAGEFTHPDECEREVLALRWAFLDGCDHCRQDERSPFYDTGCRVRDCISERLGLCGLEAEVLQSALVEQSASIDFIAATARRQLAELVAEVLEETLEKLYPSDEESPRGGVL
jgi:hypothetical protein